LDKEKSAGSIQGPVDIYLGRLCPALDPNSIIILKPGGQIGSLNQDVLIAWKANVQAAAQRSCPHGCS